VNDGGGNGGSCCGIKVRTDITKLSNNTIIARFGDGRNFIGKCSSSSSLLQPCGHATELLLRC